PRPLLGLGSAGGPEYLDGLLNVATRLLESLFAVHHAGTGAGTELGNLFCGNCGHFSSRWLCHPRGRTEPPSSLRANRASVILASRRRAEDLLSLTSSAVSGMK